MVGIQQLIAEDIFQLLETTDDRGNLIFKNLKVNVSFFEICNE